MADYIERQAALHAVNEFFHDPKVDIAINAVPTANVREDVQGEWKPGKDIFDDSTWYCSVCGEPWTLNAGTPAENNMNFCPNCGARMTGGDER